MPTSLPASLLWTRPSGQTVILLALLVFLDLGPVSIFQPLRPSGQSLHSGHLHLVLCLDGLSSKPDARAVSSQCAISVPGDFCNYCRSE